MLDSRPNAMTKFEFHYKVACPIKVGFLCLIMYTSIEEFLTLLIVLFHDINTY